MQNPAPNPANDIQEDATTIPVGDDWDNVVDHLRTLARLPLAPESRGALDQIVALFQPPETHGPKGTKRIPKPIAPAHRKG
jgi:hypothetical protein